MCRVQNGGINLDCHGDCQPSLLAKNHLFNLGTHNIFGLSDGGAIHIDNSTGYVELADNKVHDIRSQSENGGGLYIDDHSTNIYAHGNLWCVHYSDVLNCVEVFTVGLLAQRISVVG